MNPSSKAFGLAAFAVLSSVGPSLAAESITIGVIDSLTGPVAVAGTADVCGITVAAKTLSEPGAPSGGQFTLRVEDDQSRPAAAAQAAAKLAAQGIKFFVGGSISATVLAELPIIRDAGGLHGGGTTKAAQFFQSGALVFRLNSDNDQDGKVIADYVSKVIKAKRVGFVALRGAYGEGALESIKAALGPDTQIENPVFVPLDAVNFQSVVTGLTAAKPDAVIAAIAGDTQPIAFLRQFKQAGINVPLVMGTGNLTHSLAEAAGGGADGVVSADLWADDLDNPANRDLKAAFGRYKDAIPECRGKPLDKQVAISYAQLLTIARGIQKAGGTDPKTVRDTIVANEWELPQGKVKFQANGQAIATYTLIVGHGTTVVSLPHTP